MTQDTKHVSPLNSSGQTIDELLKPEILPESTPSCMPDVTLLKDQLRVAQDSVAFLQKEHASMLEGLHEEIRRMHDLCRDLQFRCEAGGCLLPDNDFFKCSPDCLEQKVNNLIQENSELKRRLAESHQAIDILDQKEKLALWQHHQELEQRDASIKELESRCTSLQQLATSSSQRKGRKSNFWRRFSFAQSGSSSSQPEVGLPTTSCNPTAPRTLVDHLSREDLPSEIQNSLQSLESHYQSYSSYSSLSDKSVSDDEGFDASRKLRLPPISRHPLKLANRLAMLKHQSDVLGVDPMQAASEVPVKRLSKA